MILFYLDYFALLITKIHVFLIVLVVRKNMLLSEKAIQRY